MRWLYGEQYENYTDRELIHAWYEQGVNTRDLQAAMTRRNLSPVEDGKPVSRDTLLGRSYLRGGHQRG